MKGFLLNNGFCLPSKGFQMGKGLLNPAKGFQQGVLLNPSDASIIAVINSITGETDTTYLDAVGTLCEVVGTTATGEITADIEAISNILITPVN